MKAIIFIIAFVVFIFFKSAAYAVSINIVNYPSSISSDSFNVTFSVTGASDGQNYFRVNLFKDGTSSYFGETYNGLGWYSGSDGKQYFPLSIISSSASATIQARLGTPGTSDYSGTGVYKLKIRRYTTSGNPSSSDVQNPVDITINYSSSTPTPLPTNTPTLTPTLTLTPTPANSPTPTLTLSPTKKLSNTLTPTSKMEETITQEVMGSTNQASDSESPAPKEDNKPTSSFNPANCIGFIFIFVGVIFLSLCGILFFWPVLKEKFSKHE